jgi:glutathione reductase (NADPH)
MGERFDLIVIGGGSAARDAASMAARVHEARVALVERERWGGSCPNVACTPTKAYLVAAELAHDMNELASKIGVETGPPKVDLPKVRARKEALKKPQEQWLADLEEQGFQTFDGEATLVAEGHVRVGDAELEAERILIATGSRTAVPPIGGLAEVAARRRRGRGRARVRAGLQSLRLASDDRRRGRPDRRRRGRAGLRHPRGGAA